MGLTGQDTGLEYGMSRPNPWGTRTLEQQLRSRRIAPWCEKRERTVLDRLVFGCYDCGEHNIYCLDFHHIDPSTKLFNISTMVSKGVKHEKLMNELEKCVVLCSNCHRKETANKSPNNWKRKYTDV